MIIIKKIPKASPAIIGVTSLATISSPIKTKIGLRNILIAAPNSIT